MNDLCTDCIAIDTNVFEHMFNPKENTENHIDTLLTRLYEDRVVLLIDDRGEVASEYERVLGPRLKEDDVAQRLQLLRYWMVYGERRQVAINPKGLLMVAIKKVIHEPREKVDRYLVAIACSEGRILITNDVLHILWGSSKESPTAKNNRRTRLFRETKKHRVGGMKLLSSREADNGLGEAVATPAANAAPSVEVELTDELQTDT